MGPRRSNVGRNVGIVVAVSVVRLFIQPRNTPQTQAYRICGACGVDKAETDELIGIMRESGFSREEMLESWEAVAPAPANKSCTQCAEAIADAAVEREP